MCWLLFLLAMTEAKTRSMRREEGSALAHSLRVPSIMVGKLCCVEHVLLGSKNWEEAVFTLPGRRGRQKPSRRRNDYPAKSVIQ